MRETIAESLDRPAPAGRCTPGMVYRLLMAGLVAAAIVGSSPLNGWAQRLPPSELTSRIQAATEAWDNTMTKAGMAQWPGRIRAAMQAVREQRFADPPD